MKDFGKKCSVLLTMGLAAFLMTGVSADAMEDAYRVPSLSGPTETWVYQGESFESSRNRVFADDPGRWGPDYKNCKKRKCRYIEAGRI